MLIINVRKGWAKMPDHHEPTYIERAIADGHVEITGEGKTKRIFYKDANHSERWSDPEEKVRAEFCAELIYKRVNPDLLRGSRVFY